MKKYNHVMLDIETLGTHPYCVILSIGAVEFDMHTSKIGNTFYRKINPKTCTDAGLVMDVDTIMWWMNQNDIARKEFKNRSESVSIEKALNEFTIWYKKINKDARVWANSHSFDCNHMQEAYERVLNGSAPWSYRNPRCYRTIMDMYPMKPTDVDRLTSHRAVDDCMYQIEHLRIAVKSLGLTKHII